MAGLTETPQGERVHIALFGRRNVGKSSLVNALTGQPVSIVSDVPGTTTDPVGKAMELLPLGPVLFIDTPGLDDDAGELGASRAGRARDVLNRADVALLVTDPAGGFGPFEEKIAGLIRGKNIPMAVILNKCDLAAPGAAEAMLRGLAAAARAPALAVSAAERSGIEELKAAIARLAPEEEGRRLVGDLLKPGGLAVLVTPIDAAAPKGRLILPQQQAIRDILDAGAAAAIVQPEALPRLLERLPAPPDLVVTDSQAFAQVAAALPPGQPLTSFSILFARYKGDLTELVAGARSIERLRDGDRILIAEGCTHHRQSDDIGTVKIPRLLERKTGRRLVFDHAAGTRYARDLKGYALVVHCGGCMLTRREMLWRIGQARAAGVPIVNYGVLLAHLNGILPRCLFFMRPQ